MAIEWYGKGDHPAGFVGWRVVVPAGNKRLYQTYFSEKPAKGWTQAQWSRRQILRAQIYDASRQCRAILRKYRWYVRTNDRRTNPAFGVGAHGIRLYAEPRARALGEWVFGFHVSRFPSQVPLMIPIRTQTLSEAWNAAVDAWAQNKDICAQDREALRRRQPDPDRFKELRRYLNEERNKDIPPSALRDVFAEQRQALSNAKAKRCTKDSSLTDDLANLYSQLSKDIKQREAVKNQGQST